VPDVQPDAEPGEPTRRAVLARIAAAAVLGTTVTLAEAGVSRQYAFAIPGNGTAELPVDPDADVLVVLCLRGGFDGLSAVVPAADPHYLDARPGIGVPTSQLLPADDRFGLHPAMGPLHRWWRSGRMAAVHAAGQTAHSRSHFRAMAELERAAPGSSLRTGWLERMLGMQHRSSDTDNPMCGVRMGTGQVSGSLAVPDGTLALRDLESFGLAGLDDAADLRRWTAALSALHDGARQELAGPAQATLRALRMAARLSADGRVPEHGADYPEGNLGAALAEVAHLVKARIGLRVACVDYGDWDLHAGSGDLDGGPMADQLRELSAALDAFATDLGPRLDGVTLVTTSEFGRRVAENGSGGTDHGYGNVMLLLGGGVNGGRVHGHWPGLDAGSLMDGDLRVTTDYRLVLAEVLRSRCGVAEWSSVFPGLSGSPLGVVRPRA